MIFDSAIYGYFFRCQRELTQALYKNIIIASEIPAVEVKLLITVIIKVCFIYNVITIASMKFDLVENN